MAQDRFTTPSSPPVGQDTSSRHVNVIVVWVIWTTLAVTIVGLRFYTRRLIVRVFGIEDWLILISVVRIPALSSGAWPLLTPIRCSFWRPPRAPASFIVRSNNRFPSS